ncbi:MULTISPECIES: hypothetical protein [unclassified Luteococcus]|uniref:hypothetical protein n=1 Tax=unclassified Luteococcus TaxID=2639923 RepID=UPI00313A9CCF
MSVIRKPILALTLLVLGTGLLTGCSSTEHTEQTTFDFPARSLQVNNPNANMPVQVVSGPQGKVSVSVTTTSVGKDATTPAWSLSGAELELGSPCSKGYVGMCEGSYTVTVPSGTSVTVNGNATPVG